MQTWAKRGMQTALVTGGLLMLGTGIASASENVNPDRPASPIDGGASIPVHVGNNAVGTPFGQVRPSTVDRTISTDDLTTTSVPRQISTPAAGVPGSAPPTASPVRTNRGRADLVVPVDLSGNAIAAGGDASVVNESHQTAGRTGPVLAGWDSGPLTGNVVEIYHAAPVQVTGNAVSVVGTADSVNDATQSATTGGNTTTTGAGNSLAGNVLAEQGATPVQVDGNAIGGGGQAHTRSVTASSAQSNGTIVTSGAGGTGAGNVGAVPFAVPVEVTNQSVSGVGNASSAGRDTAAAKGGDATKLTRHGHAYVVTNGDPSTLSGNAVVPGVANPAALTCNAAGVVGNSDAACATTNTDRAGGVVDTTGAGSTGSGNLAVVPVSEPAEIFGNGVTAAGNSHSSAANTENSKALANSYSVGDRSTLSANNATTPLAGANDVYANGISGLGNATGTGDNEVTSASGGYTGTTGNGGSASGNIGQVPVAAPVEAFGLAGTLAGNAAGTASEDKDIRAGGSPNAKDDNGTLSSNVLSTPAALPAQVFGDAAGVAGNTSSGADNYSTVLAGGNPTGTGRAGTGSGNVVQVPTAVPAQLFNDGASVVGNGSTIGSNDTTAGSGGTATGNGDDGTVAGDVVNLPAAGPIQAFGVAVASPGNEEADSLNNTQTTAGHDTVTSGDRGSIAGDVVTAQLTQVEQAFGAGVAGAGNSTANAFNNTATRSGGDVQTSGEWGALSGDLVNVPATDITQVPADGVAALGNQVAFAHSTTSAVSGGTSGTSGSGFLNGTPVVTPLAANATVFRVPVEVLGRAIDTGYESTYVNDGDVAQPVSLEAMDNQLGADQVPVFSDLFRPKSPSEMRDLHQTRVFPAIRDGAPTSPDSTQLIPVITDVAPPAAMESTQRIPLVPRHPAGPAYRQGPSTQPIRRTTPYIPAGPYQPTTSELPVIGVAVAGGLPTSGVAPVRSMQSQNMSGLPDLPPVPTLPAMPPLPGKPGPRGLAGGQRVPIATGRPSLFTPNVPVVPQDLPAGSAEQLMAQLRGLISDLENGEHPLNMTEQQDD